MVNIFLGLLEPVWKKNKHIPKMMSNLRRGGWMSKEFNHGRSDFFQQTFVSWSLGGGTWFIEGNMCLKEVLLNPYSLIPSARGFGVGFGSLNTFSTGIWNTSGNYFLKNDQLWVSVRFVTLDLRFVGSQNIATVDLQQVINISLLQFNDASIFPLWTRFERAGLVQSICPDLRNLQQECSWTDP